MRILNIYLSFDDFTTSNVQITISNMITCNLVHAIDVQARQTASSLNINKTLAAADNFKRLVTIEQTVRCQTFN